MRSQRFPSLQSVRCLFVAGLRRLGRVFQTAAPPDRRGGLADLALLEDRRLLSATPLGPEFRINTFTQGPQTLPAQSRQAVAMNAAGASAVVWASQNQDGSGWGVYGQRYDAAGNPQGSEFLVNTTTQDDQLNPAVAMDAAGGFVVVWQSHNQAAPGSSWDVYAQRYNAAGAVVGGEFLVNTAVTAQDQINPVVAMGSGGGFLVVWQSQAGGPNGWDIYAQRYDSAGVAQGGAFLVNTTTKHNQQDPAVAVDGSGNYVVTWQSQNPGGQQGAIFAQRYDSLGNPLGGELQVDSVNVHNEQAPAVAADAAGGFVIAWQVQGLDGGTGGSDGGDGGGPGPGHGGKPGWDIVAQRFDPTGSPVGGEFMVNTTTVRDQVTPAVALDASGNFLISWASQGQDNGGSWGIYGQHYDSAGNAQGGEFLINTTTHGNQQDPALGMDGRGDFLAAWSGNGVGDGSGVFGRRFVTAGVTVTPTTGLETAAWGSTATFSVALDTQPTADVTLGLSSSDTALGTVGPASLVFTPADWNVPQTVTVSGVNSLFRPFGGNYTIVTAPAVSTDPLYSGLDPADVQVTTNKGTGITVTPTSGLRTTQAGGTATFSVVLNTAPLSPVLIGLTSSDPTQGTLSASNLTFTPANWNTPQAVTVTGVDNSVADGDQPYTIVTAAAQSLDPLYSGIDPPDVQLINTNVNTAWATVTPTSLVVPASSGTATFNIALTSKPLANVTIPLSSDNPAAGTPSVASLMFTPANWNQAQTVTVTGHAPGASYNIVTAPALSTDPSYDGLDVGDVSVLNQDPANIIVKMLSPAETSEDGGRAYLSVALGTAPAANVTIGLSSSDPTLGTLSVSSLIFTPANWDQPQVVAVTGVPDFVADGDKAYTIRTAPAVSADPVYSGLDGADVKLVSHDANRAGIAVGPPWAITQGGGTATFHVALTSQPTADVSVPLRSSDPAVGIVAQASLTFTPADWNVPQAVAVQVANAPGTEKFFFTAFNVTAGPAASADPGYRGMQVGDLWVVRLNGFGGKSQAPPGGEKGQPQGLDFPPTPDGSLPPELPPALVQSLQADSAGAPPGGPGSGAAGSPASSPQGATPFAVGPRVPGPSPSPGELGSAPGLSPANAAPAVGLLLTAVAGDAGLVRQLNPTDATLVNQPPPVVWAIVAALAPAGPAADISPTAGALRSPGTPGAAGALPLPPDAALADVLSASRAARAALPATTPLTGAEDLGATQTAHAWAGFTLGLEYRPDRGLATRQDGPLLAASHSSLEVSLLPPAAAAEAVQESTAVAVASWRGSGRPLPGVSGRPLWDAHDRDEESPDTATGPDAAPAAVTGLAATAGYVLLNTRAGSWLLGALAARPLWRQFDPLEVLFAWEDRQGRGEDEDGDSLLSLVE